MDIQPIKTEAEPRAALAEIAGLMHIEHDCPEGDPLDILATLAGVYERRHFPIEGSGPSWDVCGVIEYGQDHGWACRAVGDPIAPGLSPQAV